jgi:hypothetical protein
MKEKKIQKESPFDISPFFYYVPISTLKKNKIEPFDFILICCILKLAETIAIGHPYFKPGF